MEKGPRFDLTVSQIMGDIMQLAVLINNMTEYAVFVDYSGHVNSVTVNIYKDKKDVWSKDPITHDVLYADTNEWRKEDSVITCLTLMKTRLRMIAHEKKIDFSDLRKTERVVYDYHLI